MVPFRSDSDQLRLAVERVKREGICRWPCELASVYAAAHPLEWPTWKLTQVVFVGGDLHPCECLRLLWPDLHSRYLIPRLGLFGTFGRPPRVPPPAHGMGSRGRQ